MTDTAALTELCRAYREVVRGAAALVLGCDDEAEDVAQQVFRRLWSTGGWREITQPARFFRAAGRHEALSTLRRRRRSRTVRLEDARVLSSVWEHTGPEEILSLAERRRLIGIAVSTLPPRCRRVESIPKLVETEVTPWSQAAE